jgi:hypothetical protein
MYSRKQLHNCLVFEGLAKENVHGFPQTFQQNPEYLFKTGYSRLFDVLHC